VNQVGLLVFLHCIELVWIDMHVMTNCVQYYCAYSTMNAVTQLQAKDNTQEILCTRYNIYTYNGEFVPCHAIWGERM